MSGVSGGGEGLSVDSQGVGGSLVMEPSTRQLVFLLLLLGPVPAVAGAFLDLSSIMAESHLLGQKALISLFSGPLWGNDLLIITDDLSQRLLNLGSVMKSTENSHSRILLSSQHSILQNTYFSEQTKDSTLTTLFLLHDDPSDFLHILADNKDWNPSYVVLMCLNPQLNTTSVLSQPVVQRSQFILLLQLSVRGGSPRLTAYTSLPTYNTHSGNSFTKTSLGVWDHDIFHSFQSLFPARFSDFGGQRLEVPVLCNDEPFAYVDERGRCIGGNPDALRVIGNKLNFNFSIIVLENLVWGSKINGTWTGMFGELMYGGKHLMINGQMIYPDVKAEFDWLYPHWESGFAIMLEIPPPLPQWRNVLYPFSTLTWVLVVITTVTVASTLALLLHHLHHTNDPLAMALKISGGVVVQSMDPCEVVVWWGRVWLVVWWLAVFVLVTVYTGNLVAVLTVPVYAARIQTAEELLLSKYIPCMLDYGSFVPDALKTSPNPTLAALRKKLYLEPDQYVLDPFKALLPKVYDGTCALIDAVDYFAYTRHKKKITRSTYVMNDQLYRGHMSWFLPRQTPYTPVLSTHLTRLVETGVLAKIYQDHKGSLMGQDSQVRGDAVLNLGHLQGAFIVLALGLQAAAFVLAVEFLCC